jgi:hypothetical protein
MHVKIADRCFEYVAKFRYLGMTITNQNLIQEEIKETECLLPFSPEHFVFSSAVKKVKLRIHDTIILSVVLHRCETWFLTLREEHRLKVFEKRVVQRIFGPKRDVVVGGWRKLHKELHNLYSSPSIIKTKSWKTRFIE